MPWLQRRKTADATNWSQPADMRDRRFTSFMCVSDSKITEKNSGSTSKGPRVASIGTTDKMDVERPVIDEMLVRRMVVAQFPQWEYLPVRSAGVGGWDNRSFRLGEHMVVRLPSAADYSGQVEKERR